MLLVVFRVGGPLWNILRYRLRIVEVSAVEPLFGVGDYRAKLDRLAKIAL